MKTPKTLLAFALLLFLFSTLAYSQTDSKSGFYYGAGIGIGFFYPGDVNDRIDYDMTSYTLDYGFYSIIMSEGIRLNLAYRFKNIEFCNINEAFMAPKLITIKDQFGNLDETKTYNLSRLSSGILLKYHLQLNSEKTSLHLGAGPVYHSIKFEEYESTKIGFRGEIGMSICFGKFTLQPIVYYDQAKAIDNRYFQSFELNYSSFQIGVNALFH